MARKIIVGKYPDIPAHFSKGIRNMLEAMLNVDPEKRPNVNQILAYPVVKDRIHKLLNENDFKDEFSHTILHNQNVFDEFKALQAKKKADESKKEKEALEAEAKSAADQLAAMKLDGYKPKYGQEPEVFNDMYMQFAQGIYNPVDEKSS